MKKQSLFSVLALVMIASLLLAACQPNTPAAATEVPVEAATAVPVEAATEVPTEVPPVAAFSPMKVEAPNCDYGGEFKSIEAVDEYTVKFTLCYPDPAFASKVAFQVFAIADKDYLDAQGGDSVMMSDTANGTGPYMLKTWARGDSVTYEANPNYWGAAPSAKTLIFRWSEQSAQRLLELQSGQVDGIDNPAPEDFASIQDDTTLKLYERAALNIFYIGFNVDKEPFNNEKVRQAFALAVDRQRIVDQFYSPTSSVATNFVPEAFDPGASPEIPWYDYNQEEAKKLLADAGYPNGLEVTLSYRNVVRGYLPSPDKVAQELQAQLAEVGVTVKLNEMESATFIDSTSAGNEAFYLLGWGADYPDATNFFDYHFANDNNKQFGTLFPDIVEPVRAAAKLSDPAERQKLYDVVNAKLKEHIPMIPVAHGGSAAAFKVTVEGAHTSPLGNELFSVMNPGADQLVWMQNGEPSALWCSDETDGETLRACEQVYESLLAYTIGGVAVEPSLAEKYEANADLTEWTFNLRPDVKFHNGAMLDANDVVATFKAQWDASDPNHKGRTTTFEYFGAFFGAFLNAPQ